MPLTGVASFHDSEAAPREAGAEQAAGSSGSASLSADGQDAGDKHSSFDQNLLSLHVISLRAPSLPPSR